MAYVRTVPTGSGARAVQIVDGSRRGSRTIEHIGSAHDDAEREALTAAPDRIDGLVRAAVETARTGLGASPAPPPDRPRWLGRLVCSTSPTPAAPSYCEHLGPGVEPPPPPGPGDRFPGRATLTGTAHPLLIFGIADAPASSAGTAAHGSGRVRVGLTQPWGPRPGATADCRQRAAAYRVDPLHR
jgi:hypothetical protein